MNDVLDITDLELSVRLGAPAGGRVKEQRVLVSVRLFLDTKPAAAADNPAHGVDCGMLAEEIRTLAKEERHTFERLAEDVAVLALHAPAVTSVTVTVKTFPFKDAKEVSVTITRHPDKRNEPPTRGRLIA
ncbi:MAG: dihydroneopterin aldolase [Candidatus Peribacteraceae bacterium]|nr:dihydroneopterin aldolase [Candidatus Peribacteraceae bacterium]